MRWDVGPDTHELPGEMVVHFEHRPLRDLQIQVRYSKEKQAPVTVFLAVVEKQEHARFTGHSR